jgi:hypothetical protein
MKSVAINTGYLDWYRRCGLNKLDPKQGHIQQFLPGKGPGRLSYRNLHGIVADGDELWVGTYEHGLDVLNIKTGKVVRHYNAGGSPPRLRAILF